METHCIAVKPNCETREHQAEQALETLQLFVPKVTSYIPQSALCCKRVGSELKHQSSAQDGWETRGWSAQRVRVPACVFRSGRAGEAALALPCGASVSRSLKALGQSLRADAAEV